MSWLVRWFSLQRAFLALTVTLTLLACYVDPSFLYGKLHRQGGVVFFLLGLALLAPLLWLLQRSEPRPAASSPSAARGCANS